MEDKFIPEPEEESYELPEQSAPPPNPYAAYYGVADDGAADDSSSGFGNLSNLTNYSSFAPALKARRSFKPLIIVLICIIMAAGAAAGWYFFLRGGYEVAERRALRTLISAFPSVSETGDASVKADIKIKPTSDLIDMLGLTGTDIGTVDIGLQAVTEGMEAYIEGSIGAFDLSLTSALWLIKDGMFLHFPGLSEYYLRFADNELTNSTADNQAFIDELNKALEKTLDRYFELTKNAAVTKGEIVALGDLSARTDMYAVRIDLAFISELLGAFTDAAKDSADFMAMLGDAGEMLTLLVNMFDELPPGMLTTEIATMNVYVSGRDVVKREFVIRETGVDIRIKLTALKKGSEYVNGFDMRTRMTNSWGTVEESRITITDTGTTARGKGRSGSAELKSISGGETITASATYNEVIAGDGGLWSGSINVIIPIPGAAVGELNEMFNSNFTGTDIRLNIEAETSGNTQRIRTTITFLGMKLGDIDIDYAFNTGGKISGLNVDDDHILDADDWRDADKFQADVTGAIMSLISHNDTIAELFSVF